MKFIIMMKKKKPQRCCLVLVSKGLMHRCSALIKKDQLKYIKKKKKKLKSKIFKKINVIDYHRSVAFVSLH